MIDIRKIVAMELPAVTTNTLPQTASVQASKVTATKGTPYVLGANPIVKTAAEAATGFAFAFGVLQTPFYVRQLFCR